MSQLRRSHFIFFIICFVHSGCYLGILLCNKFPYIPFFFRIALPEFLYNEQRLATSITLPGWIITDLGSKYHQYILFHLIDVETFPSIIRGDNFLFKCISHQHMVTKFFLFLMCYMCIHIPSLHVHVDANG